MIASQAYKTLMSLLVVGFPRTPAGPRRRLPLGGSFAALGARLALARRGRATATVAVLAASGAVVLLMLGLASLVTALRDDPGSVGKRYALSAELPPEQIGAVRAIPGVAAASVRYVDRGADSFALGEPVKLLAFPGDHTKFENPPLVKPTMRMRPSKAMHLVLRSPTSPPTGS